LRSAILNIGRIRKSAGSPIRETNRKPPLMFVRGMVPSRTPPGTHPLSLPRKGGRLAKRRPFNQKIGAILQVLVRDNNIDQALRVLKKKMQREGLFREMKARRAYEKPSERKTREKGEAIRRARKAARKLAQRDGLIPGPKRKPDDNRGRSPNGQRTAFRSFS
jgi:small subunit ribosomal protein S21